MCFSDPRDTAGVFVQWSCFELDVDPHFGAGAPAARPVPRSPWPSTPSSGRWSRTHARVAHRLAELAGTDVTFEDGAAGPADRPPASRWATARSPSLPCRSDGAGDLWGRPYERPRTHLLALRVDDRRGRRARPR